MKILFIAQKHPPNIGGMEIYAYHLISFVSEICPDTFSIVNTHGDKIIPLFLIQAYRRATKLIRKEYMTHVHLCDAIMAPLGIRIKKKTGVKISITVHGLDITQNKVHYQKIVPPRVALYDKIICISEYTKNECLKCAISAEKIVVIPNGIITERLVLALDKASNRKALVEKFSFPIIDKKVLLTIGRLVKRKGISRFIENVMPQLDPSIVYVISGEGSEKSAIFHAIVNHNLEKRVYLIGNQPLETLQFLYNSADLFIMPNIHLEGNTEGFGIVAIEAGSCGLPVITFGIEGIIDAVIDGKTGYLVAEKDVEGYIERIYNTQLDANIIKEEVKKRFDWKIIAQKYEKEI